MLTAVIPSGTYRGPLVVLTQEEVERVFGWAAADRHPDDVARAVRAKCERALSWERPL